MDAKFFKKDAKEDNFDIRIDRNGQWHHQDKPIARTNLTKLFSTALHYDTKTNEYWLITPAEQGRIEVEDVPYIIVDFEYNENRLTLTSNLGHIIDCDKNHIITCRTDTGLAYVTVMNNVPARLNRFVREELINIALEQGQYDKNSGELILTINNIKNVVAIDTDAYDEG